MAYSSSDHHHQVKHTPTSRDLLQLPPSQHQRTQSGYSILNDEHLYSKHSFYEPPSSDGSYDPFRASRNPIVPGQNINRNVTIHRGPDSGSRKVRPATALGHRTGSSLRMQALRNSKRQSSLVSRNSSKRSTPSTRSQRSISAKRRSVSRSSMASSHWPSSPPVFVRPGSLGKRGVSFSHLKRSSIASANTMETGGPGYTPEQCRFLNQTRDSAGASILSSPRSTMHSTATARFVAKKAASPVVPRLRLRKPESPSKYIQSEARKVSTELEKVMEEAFNRSSISSSVRTSATEPNRDISEYDTPPTSFCHTRDSGGSTIATPHNAIPGNRPLPPVPNETPNTFLQRKLAETRAEIARRLDQDGDNTAHFNEVLEHLDRLMQPASNGAKRASSAPTKSPEQPRQLPVISEEVKPDGEDRCEPYSPHYRAVTDPIRPNIPGRRTVTEQQATTIRLVDRSPTPIAPLNIRKRSGASTASREANEDRTVPWPGPAPQPTVRSYQGVQNELLAARTTENSRSSGTPIGTTDKHDGAIKKKKSSWFRRNLEEKERQQENQLKPTIGRLQIPEAWQGLDDRIEKPTPVSPSKAGQVISQQSTKQSGGSTSSEFPMRNCATAASKSDSNRERKGFFGLFGKKPKEDKGKRPMELGCEYSFLCSVHSGKCNFSAIAAPCSSYWEFC